MRNQLNFILFFLSAVFFNVFAQKIENERIITTINDKNTHFTLNQTLDLKKGDKLKIFLPAAGKDFLFVEKKKGLINPQLIGGVADAVGLGATAVGLSSSNIGTISKAIEISRKAGAVRYGMDALNSIDELAISKSAKKIAGKEFVIESWETSKDGFIVTGLIGKNKYEILLQEASIVNEVIVPNLPIPTQSDLEALEKFLN